MYQRTIAYTALLSLSTSARVYGWGALGHQTVGFIAMQLLGPNTLSFVQSSLGSQFNESLGVGATWADDVRSQTAFKWSAPFHFVDAEDNPPTSCSVNEARDCPASGCILTAIANYTARVVDTTLDATQRQQALLFVDHFLGDIGQPLHVEAIEVGGNDITAKCAGKSTNLHAVWDTGMITQFLPTLYNNSVNVWADSLVGRIKNGDFKALAEGWISCSSPTQPLVQRRSIEDDVFDLMGRSTGVVPLACPLIWAQEANAFDCSDVFSFTTGQDLCTGTYIANAMPIIELQIAKQGFRLAAWLNVLFEGATLLP